jgi:hypothetical protein
VSAVDREQVLLHVWATEQTVFDPAGNEINWVANHDIHHLQPGNA